jgi:hypothetical protein
MQSGPGDIEWSDVVEVAATAESRKRTRDETGQARYVEAVVGRDRRGRRLYMAGKEISYEGAKVWYVITIHEA